MIFVFFKCFCHKRALAVKLLRIREFLSELIKIRAYYLCILFIFIYQKGDKIPSADYLRIGTHSLHQLIKLGCHIVLYAYLAAVKQAAADKVAGEKISVQTDYVILAV